MPYVEVVDPLGVPYGTTTNPLNTRGSGGTTTTPTVVTEQGLGTLGTNQVAVAATATQIVGARTTRSGVLIINPSAVIVYVGNTSGVTTANGAPIGPGNWITLPTTSAVFGISATGTNTVAFVEVY